MSRKQLIEQIAVDLFNEDVLDLNNFGNDEGVLLRCVKEVIESNLKDFILIEGQVL